MALSDTLRVGTRTAKGTKITSRLVAKVRADEAGLVEIRENNAEVIANAIGSAIIKALEEIGIDAERIAAQQAPVDTGRLSASITHVLDPSDDSVYIGTNVEYAVYVHEGAQHPKRAGNPFLRAAVTNNADRFRAILRKHLENG